jgi:hypothetical protein
MYIVARAARAGVDVVMPQSLPAGLRNFSASRTSFVKIAEVKPCGTLLLIAIASSKSR